MSSPTPSSSSNSRAYQQQRYSSNDPYDRVREQPSYLFNGDDEDDDDFMMRIVHNSCQGVIPGDGGSLCHIPSCHASEQLDLLTHCQEPLAFLSFFGPFPNSESRGADGDNDASCDMPPAGAYLMPAACEYCGASHTNECGKECTRPALFFQKKRPPFARPNRRKWDPVTGDAILPTEATEDAITTQHSMPSSSRHGWMSGFFGNRSAGRQAQITR